MFSFTIICSCRGSVTASWKHGYSPVSNVYSTTSVMLMTWFHKTFSSKTFDFIAYIPRFELNRQVPLSFGIASAYNKGRKLNTSFTCFVFCSLFNDVSAKWFVQWSQWFSNVLLGHRKLCACGNLSLGTTVSRVSQSLKNLLSVVLVSSCQSIFPQ